MTKSCPDTGPADGNGNGTFRNVETECLEYFPRSESSTSQQCTGDERIDDSHTDKQFVVPEMINVGVQLPASDNLVTVLEKCWATHSEDPDDSVSYVFLMQLILWNLNNKIMRYDF